MTEILNFIGGHMDATVKSIRTIERRLGLVTVLMATYIFMQDKKIKKLGDELKEMKREGE